MTVWFPLLCSFYLTLFHIEISNPIFGRVQATWACTCTFAPFLAFHQFWGKCFAGICTRKTRFSKMHHVTKTPHPHCNVTQGVSNFCHFWKASCGLSKNGRPRVMKKGVFSDLSAFMWRDWVTQGWLGWASNSVHERVSKRGRIREQVSEWTVVVVWTDGWGNGVAGIQRGSFRNAGALIVLQ